MKREETPLPDLFANRAPEVDLLMQVSPGDPR
jgi:hypothetical protein